MHVSARNNVLWQMQVLSQILNTSVGQGIIVVLPRELSFDVTLGSQRLQSFDDIQVLGVDLIVLRLVEVLFGNNDTLWKYRLVLGIAHLSQLVSGRHHRGALNFGGTHEPPAYTPLTLLIHGLTYLETSICGSWFCLLLESTSCLPGLYFTGLPLLHKALYGMRAYFLVLSKSSNSKNAQLAMAQCVVLRSAPVLVFRTWRRMKFLRGDSPIIITHAFQICTDVGINSHINEGSPRSRYKLEA